MSNNAPWFHADQLSSISLAALDWLFDEGLLIRHLAVLADDTFRIEPLLKGWQTLCDDECQGFDVPPGSSDRVREVYLHGHDHPWVFVCSAAARSALEGSGFDLALLGTRSSGELSLNDSAFERGSIEVCRYPAAGLPTEVHAEGPQGRRLRSSRGALGVLVAEVFLPGLWDQTGIADI